MARSGSKTRAVHGAHDGFVQGAEVSGDRYRVVSLFSGAGGLDVGLDRTGQFDC